MRIMVIVVHKIEYILGTEIGIYCDSERFFEVKRLDALERKKSERFVSLFDFTERVRTE